MSIPRVHVGALRQVHYVRRLMLAERDTARTKPRQRDAPAVSVPAIRCWNTSTSPIRGSVTMTEAAMMLPQGSS